MSVPEGFDESAALAHSLHMALMTEVVNRTHTYLEASDPEEERVAELALGEHVQSIIDLGPEVTANVILALGSILHASGDEAKAQAFLEEQKQAIESVLRPT